MRSYSANTVLRVALSIICNLPAMDPFIGLHVAPVTIKTKQGKATVRILPHTPAILAEDIRISDEGCFAVCILQFESGESIIHKYDIACVLRQNAQGHLLNVTTVHTSNLKKWIKNKGFTVEMDTRKIIPGPFVINDDRSIQFADDVCVGRGTLDDKETLVFLVTQRIR